METLLRLAPVFFIRLILILPLLKSAPAPRVTDPTLLNVERNRGRIPGAKPYAGPPRPSGFKETVPAAKLERDESRTGMSARSCTNQIAKRAKIELYQKLFSIWNGFLLEKNIHLPETTFSRRRGSAAFFGNDFEFTLPCS